MNGTVGAIIASLAPTVLVGLVFWYILRSLLRADRTERRIYARMEAAERRRRGLPPRAPLGARPGTVEDVLPAGATTSGPDAGAPATGTSRPGSTTPSFPERDAT